MTDDPYSAPKSESLPAAEQQVSVQISAKWVERVNSPYFVVIAAFTGVSITFVSLAMLGLGILNQWNVLTVSAAIACWLVGYIVPLFYFRLAGEVIRQIHRKSTSGIKQNAFTQH